MSERENPFAGLRPYDVEENYLFFGREKAVDELLLRLGRDNFLAVLGPSGSGKSSVVRAGLIPSLEGGQLRRAGPRWRVAIMRPGGDPFGHLADSLAGEELLGSELAPAQARAMMLSRLRRGSRGLSDLMGMSTLGKRENLLILVDQFEELFRFAQDQRDGIVDDEAASFVQLLLDAAESPTDRLYVALTMRSDFLGDCARYRGLAEALSQFMYLVPRMTRSERRAAITGPIAIETARAEPRLVSRLLNEADDAPDQLPVLQHALRQTWEAAAKDIERGKPLDSKHYVAAGRIAGALDQHAESALADLDDDGKDLARQVFQTITELGPDNRGIRRPTRLGTIAEITGASIAQVVAALEPFRREGRGFVMPRTREVPEPDAETVIDISHEALMRAWGTLNEWVRDEAESVATYRRLATTAAQFPDDPDWLYPDPALTAALGWRDTQAPRAEWGQRHEPNFEQALEFLDRSRDHRDAAAALAAAEAQAKLEAAQALAEAEANKALLAKRNARVTRVFLGIALLLLLFAGWAWNEAREKTKDAVAAQKQALGNLEIANAAQRGAETARNEAELAQEEAEDALGEAKAAQEAEALALADAEESAEEAKQAAK
ncbi:MAG: hypothetical protein KDA24_26675, partial [Deltaproteobacteria bacterium]|nr:hypothetical protein [Deltaproteobacteria bacterium]